MSKLVLVAGVVFAASTASAEGWDNGLERRVSHESQGTWLDVGALWERVDAGNDAVYAGKLVRFAPNVALGRTFYLGGEIDVGTIEGEAPAMSTLGRSSSGTLPAGAVTGSLAAIKGIAGARVFVGPISAAAELAGGMRHAAVEDMLGREVTAIGDRGLVEARARLDLWATPSLTLGALAGVDLGDPTNLMFGIQLGLHFVP